MYIIFKPEKKCQTASVDTMGNRTPLAEAQILFATKARSIHLTKLTDGIVDLWYL